MAKRILVIDDSQDLMDAFEEFLTEAGYCVSLQAAGHQDLAAVKRVRPDLIISDYVPTQGTYCWQFLQQLKRDREMVAIPLIICTTSSTLAWDHGDWLRANDVQVVAKPFDVEEILAAVARAIGTADAELATPAKKPSQA
jgi:DNA-binding NtrC family response regulator